jgi:hypothetical protein
MIKLHELPQVTLLVSREGGEIEITHKQTGEVVAIGLQPGEYKAARYAQYMTPDHELYPGEGVTAIQRKRSGRIRHPSAMESGANPDFRPTLASQFEVEMRKQLAALAAKTDRLERREKALQLAQQAQQQPKPAEEVIDDGETESQGEATPETAEEV